LIVTYSYEARKTLSSIWSWNSETYGKDHADEYVDFLQSETDKLAEDPYLGQPVTGRLDLRQLTIRRSPKGHGRRAVYQLEPSQVLVLDYFHTAQDIERRIMRFR
jgi:plasmid stabilization system protein ParE